MLSQGQAHVQQGMGDHNQLTSLTLTLLWLPSVLWAMFGVVTSKPCGTPGIYKARINTPLLSDLRSFWSLSGFVGRTWLFYIPRAAEAFSISVGFTFGSQPCWIQVVWMQKATGVCCYTNSMQSRHLQGCLGGWGGVACCFITYLLSVQEGGGKVSLLKVTNLKSCLHFSRESAVLATLW